MKKWIAVTVAAFAITAGSACSSSDTETATTSTSTATPTDATSPSVDLAAVSTWPEFGHAADRLLSDCKPKSWGCISGAYEELNEVYARMPHDAQHSPRAIDRWLDTYQVWEDNQCWTSEGSASNYAVCAQKEMAMNTLDESLRRAFIRMETEP